MNNTAYAAGLACGILFAVAILLIFRKFNKNKLKGTFDERQELVKGRGYKYATFTFLTLITLDLVTESFGAFETLPVTRELVLFFILIIGVLVYAVYCIMNDAYLGVGTNMRSYRALMWIIIVLNGVSAIMGFRDGAMVDGIFYGLAWKLGWLDYRVEDRSMPMDFEIPECSARELASDLVHKLGLRGTRLIGDPDARVRRVHIPMHLIGPDDDPETRYVDEHEVDCLLCMETTDFTTCECIRDAAQLGQGKAAITIGHFNVEEPGMEYMPHWVGRALGTDEVACSFVPQGDPFHYVLA